MRPSIRFISLFISIILTGLLVIQCDLAEAEDEEEESGVTINLNVPAGIDVSGKTWEIFLTVTLESISTGMFDYQHGGTCTTGQTQSIILTNIPAGTYYMFAIIYMGASGNGPQMGDYIGVYGVSNPEDLTTPNAVIPETGVAVFDITMWYNEEGDDYENAILTGNLLLPSPADGKEWSVYLDTDDNWDNGWDADEYGSCGTETSEPYFIMSAYPGTYKLRAIVHTISSPGSQPVSGDYYGTLPVVIIPVSGQVNYDVQLTVYAP